MANQNQDVCSSKAEQEYMDRLAKEFASLPDRELPQGGSSPRKSPHSLYGGGRRCVVTKQDAALAGAPFCPLSTP